MKTICFRPSRFGSTRNLHKIQYKSGLVILNSLDATCVGLTSSLIYKRGLIEFNQDLAVGHDRLTMAHPRVGLCLTQARLRFDRVLSVCAKTTLHVLSSSWERGFRKGWNDFQGFEEKFLTLDSSPLF